MKRRHGFTLVELLVVIGIIALLISILLPSLNAARQSANKVACLSNLRQMGMAVSMHVNERKGYGPVASPTEIVWLADPSRTRWQYREDGTVMDWASQLLPYMGKNKVTDNFQEDPENQLKVFQCPSDSDMSLDPAGHKLLQNVTHEYQPISYGINADIASISNEFGQGHYTYAHMLGVYKGPQTNAGYGGSPNGAPLQAKNSRVIKPAETMLFADCGTRPYISGGGIEDNQVLAYSSHWSNIGSTEGGTLYHTYLASWLRDKIPLLRHGGQRSGGSYRNAGINVVFCDGHAEWVALQDFKKVRISPYEY